MKALTSAAHRLARAMHLVSGALLIVMMATVLADVVGRSLFGATEGAVDLTFPGAVETVSYALLLMVLFALPYSVGSGQVIVDLFAEKLSERVKSLLAGVYTLGFGLLGLGMAVRFFEAVGRVAATGETTRNPLLPVTWVYAVTDFATAVLALRGLMVAAQQIGESWKAS